MSARRTLACASCSICEKLGQLIPVAGAAIGAGVNYWFTEQTARTATMLSRSLYLERKERL